MSLKILKAGILDTIQDMGRYGFRESGINPTGAMDKFAVAVANALTGNHPGEAVIEMHFPGPVILFESPVLIALSGADFGAEINGNTVPLNQPLIVNKNSVLQFQHAKKGSRCYLSVKGGYKADAWLNSYSTNLKAEAGGINGGKISKDYTLGLKEEFSYSGFFRNNDIYILPWKADLEFDRTMTDEILVLQGAEWGWLDKKSGKNFLNEPYIITAYSDRMGYRLKGEIMNCSKPDELVSSAVSFGTIQLLPGGQMIILMADHQTTGGYPRIANVISAHHSRLAQMKTGEKIYFRLTGQPAAERLLIKQQQHLQQLQNACTFRLEKFLYENN